MVESSIPVSVSVLDDDANDEDDDSQPDSAKDSDKTTTTTTTDLQLVRRGSSRANVPLSAYRRTTEEIIIDQALNATTVAEHLLDAFRYAAEIIPVQFHATTPVKYQATAGMRLLSVQEQDVVYDALYTGLTVSSDFVFSAMQRLDIATLPGDLEGFYGAVAANYLKGTIDADLQMISLETVKANAAAKTKAKNDLAQTQNVDEHEKEQDHHHHHGPIGALDMGGSSTQIVFLPGMQHQHQEDATSCVAAEVDPLHTVEPESTTADSTCHTATLAELPSRLNGQDFFATSYLSYGVDQFRTRLWDTWVQEHAAAAALTTRTAATQNCDSKRIDNPCTFKGYEIEWEGYTLVGTGDAHECVLQVQRLIPHPNESASSASASDSTSTNVDNSNDSDDQDRSDNDNEDDNSSNSNTHRLGKHVGGVQHPPVRGKFFAMSLYFFTLDSLRTLSHPDQEAWAALNLSWPTPSIAELYNALDGLCSRSWQGDLEEIQHEAHAYTRPEVLPHRCLESVYMVTLLRDGFGFAPESRDITFTFLVDGSEVEWSLGMALVLRAEESTSSENDTTTGTQDDSDAPSTDRSRRSDSSNATYQHTTRKDPISGLYEEMTHQLFASAS